MDTNRFILFITYLLIVNIAAFFLYGWDKYKAKHHRYRISEAALLLSGYIGGAYGAFLGMKVWRHKTRKNKFRILVPLAVILWTLLIFKICTSPVFYFR